MKAEGGQPALPGFGCSLKEKSGNRNSQFGQTDRDVALTQEFAYPLNFQTDSGEQRVSQTLLQELVYGSVTFNAIAKRIKPCSQTQERIQ